MEENKKAAQKKKISHAIIMVVLILLFLMFIFPFILVIINAFKTKGDIMSDPMALVGSHGFIVTKENLKINVEGMYAAGDIRSGVVRQVTIAVAEGTKAAMEVIKEVLKKK